MKPLVCAIFALSLLGCASKETIKPDPERDKAFYILGRNAGVIAYARLETRQLETGKKFTIDEVLMLADSLVNAGLRP